MSALLATVQSQILSSACQASTDPNCTSATAGLPFQTIADTLLYITGGISVIIVIIGGLRYVLSAGNPAGTKQARETILYALIGLGIASVAYLMVSFVAGRFTP